MARYVDGFLLPVPKDNLQAYKKMAKDAGKVWIRHGALAYFECVGDDVNPTMEGMKFLTFPQVAKLKKDEVAIFSFVVYKSKSHRNKVNAKVMKEFMASDKYKNMSMPFDVKRMAYGGFKTLVDLSE